MFLLQLYPGRSYYKLNAQLKVSLSGGKNQLIQFDISPVRVNVSRFVL